MRAAGLEDRAQLSAIPSAVPFLLNEFLLIAEHGQIVSFLAFQRLAPGEAEILQIETLPPWRRRGYARTLLTALLKQNPGELFLEVRASNAAAVQLYQSEGFTLIRERRDYYYDPAEDALVLHRRS